jgi:hypothetical protein
MELILSQAGNDIGLHAARFENLDGGGGQLVGNENARGHMACIENLRSSIPNRRTLLEQALDTQSEKMLAHL